ncbi:MAG: cardiolipin synthase [Oscillospiraceae bacterium]|nr:cardiolipin synthase [Oscillospiraceae bacterium]
MKVHTFKSLLFRRFIILLILLFQAALIIFFALNTSRFSIYIYYFLRAVSLLVALHTVSRPQESGYKLIWVFLILLFPVFGGLFYLIFNRQISSRRLSRRILEIHENTRDQFLPRSCPRDYADVTDRQQVTYLQNHCWFPAYPDTRTTYLSPGEEYFAALLEQLKKAEKYIFLEFFIISHGKMWEAVLNILQEKIMQGVDVRVIYDDMGCLYGIPIRYYKQLNAMGIPCRSFNPFRPVLAALQNNRDHRKIVSVDGKVAFTGGINLADEYINAHERFGHWKDCGVMLEGPGAWSLTVMFLQMWQLLNPEEKTDYPAFLPDCEFSKAPGLVQPYSDSPMDPERVSENMYLRMIYSARHFLEINTPYLIVDDTLKTALKQAAKSGVEVSIITPQRWDKRIVHFTTRSYYPELLEYGVKIYEYQGGFNHSKTMCADGRTAVIGTANLDYRSLYLHFECGVYLENTDAVRDLHEDFQKMLSLSAPVRPEDIKGGFFRNLLRDICHLFAPVL